MEDQFEKYKNSVKEKFEKDYLIPQLGEGKVKEGLLEGLLKTLDGFEFVEKRIVKDIKDQSDYSYLKKPIDYDKLRNNSLSQNTYTRAVSLLRHFGTESLLDLIKAINYSKKWSPSRERIWNKNTGQKAYSEILRVSTRDFGKHTLNAIIGYMKEEGFDFSKKYFNEIMEHFNEE
jgi:hypothetical protein